MGQGHGAWAARPPRFERTSVRSLHSWASICCQENVGRVRLAWGSGLSPTPQPLAPSPPPAALGGEGNPDIRALGITRGRGCVRRGFQRRLVSVKASWEGGGRRKAPRPQTPCGRCFLIPRGGPAALGRGGVAGKRDSGQRGQARVGRRERHCPAPLPQTSGCLLSARAGPGVWVSSSWIHSESTDFSAMLSAGRAHGARGIRQAWPLLSRNVEPRGKQTLRRLQERVLVRVMGKWVPRKHAAMLEGREQSGRASWRK